MYRFELFPEASTAYPDSSGEDAGDDALRGGGASDSLSYIRDLGGETELGVDLEDGPGAEVVAAEGEDVDAEDGKAQEEIKLSPSQALVEIIRLLAQSPEHKYMFLAELEWAIIPPVKLGQFRLFHKEGRVVGFVSWAMVNERVEERLKRGVRRLKPGEWKCGGRRVVVDVVGGGS